MANLNAPFNRRGATVIPDGWAGRHRHIPDETATAEVAVHAGADPEWVWDDDLAAEVRDLGPLLWEGHARIQQRIGTTTVPAGGQQVTTHRYLVSVPLEVAVEAGGWVSVTASDDPTLELLRVVDVLKGSLRWERDLMCTDHLDQPNR